MRFLSLAAPVAAALIMSLGGCGSQPAPAPSPTPTATADGYVAKVAALPPKQRDGVLLRAIRDADQPCQDVVADKRVPAGRGVGTKGVGTSGTGTNNGAANGAAWLATCDDQGQWLVAIADDGTATVANAQDVSKQD